MKRLLLLCGLCLAYTASAAPALPYVELALNYGGLQTPDVDYRPSYSSSYNAAHQVGGIGFGVTAGYLFNSYQFHLAPDWRVGVEADYNQFADNTYGYGFRTVTTQYTYSSYTISALGVVHYQNDAGWLAFLKGGATRVIQTMKQRYSTQSIANFVPQITLGTGFQVTELINLNVSYNYVMGETHDVSQNTMTAPLSYLAFTVNFSFA